MTPLMITFQRSVVQLVYISVQNEKTHWTEITANRKGDV